VIFKIRGVELSCPAPHDRVDRRAIVGTACGAPLVSRSVQSSHQVGAVIACWRGASRREPCLRLPTEDRALPARSCLGLDEGPSKTNCSPATRAWSSQWVGRWYSPSLGCRYCVDAMSSRSCEVVTFVTRDKVSSMAPRHAATEKTFGSACFALWKPGRREFNGSAIVSCAPVLDEKFQLRQCAARMRPARSRDTKRRTVTKGVSEVE